MRWAIIGLVFLPAFADAALADALVTTRVIKAGAIIQLDDLTVVEADIPGALTDAQGVAGQEALPFTRAGRSAQTNLARRPWWIVTSWCPSPMWRGASPSPQKGGPLGVAASVT